MLARHRRTGRDPLVASRDAPERRDARLVNQRIAVRGVDIQPIDHRFAGKLGGDFGDRDGGELSTDTS